jgi:hypothetical protein
MFGSLDSDLLCDEEESEDEADESDSELEQGAGQPEPVDKDLEQAETDLLEQQKEVQKQEEEMVKLASRVQDIHSVHDRIALCEQGSWRELEELSRAAARNKQPRKGNPFCTNLCVLTVHDHSVQRKDCSVCGLSCHVTCELWGAALQEQQGPLVCLTCRPAPLTSYTAMKD